MAKVSRLSETFAKIYEDAIEEVEETTGLDVLNAFDEFRQNRFEDHAEGRTMNSARARTFYEDGRVGLEYSGDLTARELAHETVHGHMLHGGRLDERLPGENRFEMRLYSEFAANLAGNLVDDLGPDISGIMAFIDARSSYREVKEEVLGQEMDADDLYEEFLQVQKMEGSDREVMRDAILQYQGAREDVVAAQAAREYAKDHDYDLEEYLEPGEELYHETVEYVKNFEQEILDRANATR